MSIPSFPITYLFESPIVNIFHYTIQISDYKPWIDCIVGMASQGFAHESAQAFCAQYAKPKGSYIQFKNQDN